MRRFSLPLIAFGILVALLGVGLGLKPAEVPSPLIGKAVPQFRLARLDDAARSLTPGDMAGQVWLLNVWASWCTACREEHPALLAFAGQSRVPVIGLNYKDVRADGIGWLNKFGNPYSMTALDLDGRVGIDFGVYGVPETFVIDKKGIIRFKFIGGLTPELVRTKLLPLIEELEHA
jgi:cytochrome c biogenesis protein CcmG/thiol:disulfide interchange protein DsbE